MQCISRAWTSAALQPNQVDYVEMHATGTKVGDRAEGETLEIFANERRADRPLLVGSTKSNTGHTEFAAFLVSLLKCIHVLQSKRTVEQINCKRMNPNIEWKKYNATVTSTARSLQTNGPDGTHLIGITSTGFGGANGHVVIESFSEHLRVSQKKYKNFHDDSEEHICFSGGLTEGGLQKIWDTSRVRAWNDQIALRMMRRARQLPWRGFALSQQGVMGDYSTEIYHRLAEPSKTYSLCFLYAGQGPQHYHMGRELFQHWDVARKSLMESDNYYHAMTGESLMQQHGLFSGSGNDDGSPDHVAAWGIKLTLSSICALQIALTDVMTQLGLTASIVMGHSAGEVAMLYAAGVYSHKVAMQIATARGLAMEKTEHLQGGMLALSCSVRRALALMDDCHQDGLYIACVNASDSVTIGGNVSKLLKLSLCAQSNKVAATMLRTKVAAHTPFMGSCLDNLKSLTDSIFEQNGLCQEQLKASSDVAIISSSTGVREEGPFDSYYWMNNTSHLVRFDEATRVLQNQAKQSRGIHVLEFSPHPVVGALVRTREATEHTVESWPLLRRAKTFSDSKQAMKEERHTLLSTIGQLFCRGHSIKPEVLYNCTTDGSDSADLPKYPFDMTAITAQEASSAVEQNMDRKGPLACFPQGARISASINEDLAEHIVDNSKIVPGAALVEAVFESLENARCLKQVHFKNILPLTESRLPVTLMMETKGEKLSLVSRTFHELEGSKTKEERIEHFAAIVDTSSSNDCSTFFDFSSLNCVKVLKRSEKNYIFRSSSQMGPLFQRLNDIRLGEAEAVASIFVQAADCRQYQLSPFLLDALFQMSIPILWSGRKGIATEYHLPHSIDELKWRNFQPLKPGQMLKAHAKVVNWHPGIATFDAELCTRSGDVIVSLRNFRVSTQQFQPLSVPNIRYGTDWQPLELSARVTWPLDFPLVEDRCHAVLALFKVLDSNAGVYLGRCKIDKSPSDPSMHQLRYLKLARDHRSYGQIHTPPVNDSLQTFSTVLDRVAPQMNLVCMGDEQAAIRALFIDDLMSRFYKELSTVDESSKQAVSALYETARCANRSGKKVLRILEVGAGTGALTTILGKAWLDRPSDLSGMVASFTITDLSISFAEQAIEELPLHFAATPAVLDIGAEDFNGSTRLQRSSYDVIVARDVLHAARDISRACRNLANLLVAGGSLIVIDMDRQQFSSRLPGTLFCDAVFGCFREWCGYTDDRIDHCTLTGPGWTELLERSGFENVAIRGQGSIHFSHIVIQAQRTCATTSSSTVSFDHEDGDQVFVDRAGLQWKRWNFRPGCEAILASRLCMSAKSMEDDIEKKQDIGFLVIAGQSPESEGCKGLFRSFKREYPHVRARFIQVEEDDSKGFRLSTGDILGILDTTEVVEMRLASNGAIWVPIVKTLPGPSNLAVSLSNSAILDSEAAYLVAGGCSSMGLHVIEWMYRKGARKIIATSRRGPAFVEDLNAQQDRMLQNYLIGLDDLDLNYQAVDVVNVEAVTLLCKRQNFGGVVYMAAAFADKPLEHMKTHDFETCYNAKSVGVSNLFKCISPSTWFIAMSSLSSLVGNAGAANYAAANTRMESQMSQRELATAILLPSIANAGRYSDLSVDLTGKNLLTIRGAQDWEEMAISVKQMTLQLEDALLCLLERYERKGSELEISKSPCYIGSVPLHILIQHEPLLEPLFGHLLPRTQTLDRIKSESYSITESDPMRNLISEILHISAGEINDSVPLRIYGVDSIVATRLISTLNSRYHIRISQLELLGQVTLQQLQEKYISTHHSRQEKSMQTSFNVEAQSESIIKLNAARSGRPIFFIHGGGGAVNYFKGLTGQLCVPAWGLQETAATSTLTSVREVLNVYVSSMRKIQPKGPYRLVAFCLGATWAPLMVDILHDQGEEVDRLFFIDGSPTMFAFTDDISFVEKSLLRVNIGGYRVFSGLLKEILKDKEYAFPVSVVQELLKGLSKEEGSAWVERFFDSAERQVLFAVREYWNKGCNGEVARSTTLARQLQGGHYKTSKLLQWLKESGLSSMRTNTSQSSSIPICIVTMSRGISKAYPVCASDLDLSLVSNAVTAINVDGSHYNAFAEGSAANARVVEAMNTHFYLSQ